MKAEMGRVNDRYTPLKTIKKKPKPKPKQTKNSKFLRKKKRES